MNILFGIIAVVVIFVMNTTITVNGEKIWTGKNTNQTKIIKKNPVKIINIEKTINL